MLNMLEKPPPEPKPLTAISGSVGGTADVRVVAPTEVTYGQAVFMVSISFKQRKSRFW